MRLLCLVLLISSFVIITADVLKDLKQDIFKITPLRHEKSKKIHLASLNRHRKSTKNHSDVEIIGNLMKSENITYDSLNNSSKINSTLLKNHSAHVETHLSKSINKNNSSLVNKKQRRSQDTKVSPHNTLEETSKTTIHPSDGAPNLENKLLAYETFDESNFTSTVTHQVTEKQRETFDIVTRFLRIVESQHLLGDNCTAGTDLNLGEGVVDRYAQERFRVEADVAVNRANTLTRLWKYAGKNVMDSEYFLHTSVRAMVEFDSDIFAAGNCYDKLQYKDYWLFCPYAYRLPEGTILAKDLAVEYKYLSNSSEWFYIARKNAERVIAANRQFSRGFNTYTHNETAHSAREPDEILAVTYEDGRWSKPYYDCGGGNIWMLTYTVPFFGYNPEFNNYFFKGTSGIDIDLRRVDIDQCPLRPDSTELNIFAASDKCKTRTTECVPVSGLGFRRGSYMCVCRRGFFFPDLSVQQRYFNGTVIEEEYEKLMLGEPSKYSEPGHFECSPCADGCDACVDASPCVLALNWGMRTAVLALGLVPVCCLPAVVWFTCRYGNVKVVRAASPVLLRVIALGAFLIYCTTIVMYPQPNMITCSLRVWLREIGFSLTYGALMLKTWRISVIFRVRSAKAVRITDVDLLKRLGFIVGAFAALLVMRTLVAPPPVIVVKSADDLKAFLCRTDWWDHCFSLMEVVLLVWGIWLCIGVRKAPSEFNESRFISLAIYNEFLLSIFLNISMLFLQSPANPDLLYLIFFSHTQLTVTMLMCFIFGSKAYMVYKGQGKSEETGGSYATKPAQTAIKFLTASSRNSPRGSPSRSYATSHHSQHTHGLAPHHALTNSNTPTSSAVHEADTNPNEEFLKLCEQLELLRTRNSLQGNRHLLCKITAIQRAISEVEECSPDDEELDEEEEDENAGGMARNLNNVLAAVTDKIVCATMSRVASEESEQQQDMMMSDTIPSDEDKKVIELTAPPFTTAQLDMSVESSTLNRSLRQAANNIVINLDDKTHFTNEISV